MKYCDFELLGSQHIQSARRARELASRCMEEFLEVLKQKSNRIDLLISAFNGIEVLVKREASIKAMSVVLGLFELTNNMHLD